MAGRGVSRQELIRRWRQGGFVGRQGELSAFKDALRRPPDETAQFIFHIHGPAGVGKSTLVRQLESAAREAGALTAYVDESAADVIEAMDAVSVQFAQQGAALKGFGKLLDTYRQRRHEADAGAAAAGPAIGEATGAEQGPGERNPSPSSVIMSQLGLVGLGMLPGVGAFTGAVDPNQLAAGADRIKAILSARLRSHEDVQLVLSPLQALTPALLDDLTEAAQRRPWTVLFFDTYERTGPMLDEWLRSVLVSDRYGELPANVLVVVAGQRRLDPRCWGDWFDLVTDLPLDVFTETEARQLLTGKGITDEQVVAVILQLSGRLPVLLSTLAEARPASVAEVGDPSGTAVERFLKWEADPARRAASLAAALPQEFDEDIFRAAVEDEQARGLFGWLRAMPFVTDRAGHCHYHDIVRTAMLRLQRQQSPVRWQDHHNRLATAFHEWRSRLEDPDVPTGSLWEDELWRRYRLQETYHRLCAEPRTALPGALRELLDAHDHNTATLRRWAQTLTQAGQDADAPSVREWGQQILGALAEAEPGVAALSLLLARGALDTSGRYLAHVLRAREHRHAKRYEQAVADYTTALTLQPDAVRPYVGRGLTHNLMSRYEEALADLTRALELDPDNDAAFGNRSVTYRLMGRREDALADLTRALELDPDYAWAFASRGETYRQMDRFEEALADLSRAIELNPDYAWAFASRGDAHRLTDRFEEAVADLDRAVEIDPEYAWALAHRGETHRQSGRFAEALADLTRAVELNPDYAWALASRGVAHRQSGRFAEALADLDRALELNPDYAWALANRGVVHRQTRRYEEALADLTRATTLAPDTAWTFVSRATACYYLGRYDEEVTVLTRALELDPARDSALVNRAYTYRLIGRYEEALADLDRALELNPDSASAFVHRGATYRYVGRYEEALTDLDRAVALNPGNSWARYERAVALHALRVPGHETALRDVAGLLAAGPAAQDPPTIADKGNLFLVHCVMARWEEADRYLTDFLGSGPARGQTMELLAAMNSLVRLLPATGGRLSSFRARFENALGTLGD